MRMAQFVSIPDTVEKVSEGFYRCRGLSRVTFGDLLFIEGGWEGGIPWK